MKTFTKQALIDSIDREFIDNKNELYYALIGIIYKVTEKETISFNDCRIQDSKEGFSTRTIYAIQSHYSTGGIIAQNFMLSQLFDIDSLDLWKIKGLGKKSVTEILDFKRKYSQ